MQAPNSMHAETKTGIVVSVNADTRANETLAAINRRLNIVGPTNANDAINDAMPTDVSRRHGLSSGVCQPCTPKCESIE